ncbi:GIY-YIG nuclease family protein [Ligilactobacillus agilis]|nr:GIY-YIG nuclease family protein [Ligilactobacillus agilis]
MADQQFRKLDDIFNDPELDEILKPLLRRTEPVTIDPDITSFREVQDWVKKHERMPEDTRKDLTERRMFHRLKGLLKKYDKLKEYDELGLLVSEEDDNLYNKLSEEVKKDTNTKTFASLDDILDDDSILFNDLKPGAADLKLFDTEKVTRKQDNKPDSIAKRQKVADFSEYKQLFKKIQSDLASGRRKLRPFKNYQIDLHHFYVLRGQLVYIEAFGEEVQKDNKNGQYKDKRVHIIYENGTESNVLYRGLAASLYGRGGKFVTEPDDNIKLTMDDNITGYIYILKSLSKDPQIAEFKSLYKIGFTSGSVKKRIANAENESTYLYAPVKLIEQIQVINLNPEALETAIHHALADYQLKVDIKAPNGKLITPREWFVVELSKVEEIINAIVARLQSEQ